MLAQAGKWLWIEFLHCGEFTAPGGGPIFINLLLLGVIQFTGTHFWSRQRMRSCRSFASVFAVG